MKVLVFEGVGVEGCFIIVGRGDGGLIVSDYVFQRGLLDYIKVDVYVVGFFYVVDMMRLQDGVDCQVLNVQFYVYCI